MSLIGTLPQSDRSYPTSTLWALERLREWLQGGEDDRGIINFGRALDDMKYRTEFQPSYASNEPEPMIIGGRLEYREPVWKIIHEVSAKYAPTSAMSQEECAEWVKGLLQLAYKHRKTTKLIKEFTAKLQEAKISFVLCAEGSGAVHVFLNSAISGENAMDSLTSIVERIIGELSARIEQMGS